MIARPGALKADKKTLLAFSLHSYLLVARLLQTRFTEGRACATSAALNAENEFLLLCRRPGHSKAARGPNALKCRHAAANENSPPRNELKKRLFPVKKLEAKSALFS